MRDEQLLLARRHGDPMTVAGPHDHLRHRRVPLPSETKGRRRLLALWSAVSTSLLLVVIMVVVLESGWTVTSVGVEAVLVLLGIEALARKQLLRFALILVAFVVVGFMAIAITTRLIEDWRVVVAGIVGLAAAALLFLNVRELLRD